MSRPPEASVVDGRPPWVVGIAGAGQLARMLCEAASALDIGTVVLAEHPDDSATTVAGAVLAGSPRSDAELRALAGASDVVTFDHEQVNLSALATLEREGVTLRPGTATLALAVDKGRMRRRLADAGLPVPAFSVLPAESAVAAVEAFAAEHGWPVVVKATRGGYDGKGVWIAGDVVDARRICRQAALAGVALMVEELVAISAELAVVIARRPGGEMAVWPVVETFQVDGVCREVLFPGRLGPDVAQQADRLARQVATLCDAVGVLAVELFWTGDALIVNEIASRPHNTAHWTIEGAATSQFENHLRAVLDLPLGSTEAVAPSVASVNVFGPLGDTGPGPRLPAALAVRGAHIHLYGKATRPGRKLGHVTVCGSDVETVRERAWAAATALGSGARGGTGYGYGARS
ncbi:MAG: 5-(carboxyamino)imidazole ribonucleotide synthase [Acidimicrobiales bacterium]